MKLPTRTTWARRSCMGGFTLTEVMVASSLGVMVLAAVAFMSLYASRTQIAVTNYTDLEAKSRFALDVISREVRQANAVLSFQTNLPIKSLTLTNRDQAALITLTYDSGARTVSLAKTGQSTMNVLTECDRWDFNLYQRTPLFTSTNVSFYYATNSSGIIIPSLCKLVNISWKCSRFVATQRVSTESVQAAQLVLRNKQ